MNLRRLIGREILHRKLSFGLAVATIATSVAGLVAVVALLGAHDLRTSKMLTRMNEETSAMEAKFTKEMKAYEDDVRKNDEGTRFQHLHLSRRTRA